MSGATGRSTLAALTILALVVGAVAVVAALVLVRRERVLSPGGEIVYGDVGFSVVSSRTVASLGEGAQRADARGAFRVVALKVSNHSQRVPFRMGDYRAVLRDEDWRGYQVSPVGQAALGAPEPTAEIPPGESHVSEFVFDVPADTRGLALRITSGGPLMDLLDALVSGEGPPVLPLP